MPQDRQPKSRMAHSQTTATQTLLKANGEDVKVVQESLCHANSRITLEVYTQATTPAKRQAQGQSGADDCPILLGAVGTG